MGDPRAAVEENRRVHVAIVVGDEDLDGETFGVQAEDEFALDFAPGTRCKGRDRDKKAGDEHPGKNESTAHRAHNTLMGQRDPS